MLAHAPARFATGLSPSLVVRSNTFAFRQGHLLRVLQPRRVFYKTRWFGLFPVRSPLLRESRLISLRRATEMFQFAHCPLA